MVFWIVYIVLSYVIALVSGVVYIVIHDIEFADNETPLIVVFWFLAPIIVPLFLPVIIASLIKIVINHKREIAKYLLKAFNQDS